MANSLTTNPIVLDTIGSTSIMKAPPRFRRSIGKRSELKSFPPAKMLGSMQQRRRRSTASGKIKRISVILDRDETLSYYQRVEKVSPSTNFQE